MMKVPPSTSTLKGIVQQLVSAPLPPPVMMPPSLDDESSSSSMSSTISTFPDNRLNKNNTTATKSDKRRTQDKVDASKSLRMKKTKKEKNHVRFDESQNKSYENADYFKEELKGRWYSRDERRTFRKHTKQWAKRIYTQQVHEGGMLHNPNAYYRVLRRMHQTCRDLSRADKDSKDSKINSILTTNDDDHAMIMGSTISTTCFLKDAEKECLQWPGLVGMELMNSYDHSNLVRYQQRRRFQTLMVVFHFQKKYPSSKSKSSSTSEDDDEIEMDGASKKEAEIRKYCEKVSLPARLFATHLAQAQATYDG